MRILFKEVKWKMKVFSKKYWTYVKNIWKDEYKIRPIKTICTTPFVPFVLIFSWIYNPIYNYWYKNYSYWNFDYEYWFLLSLLFNIILVVLLVLK